MKRKVLSISRSVRVLLPVVLVLISCTFVAEAQNETPDIEIIKNKVPKHLPIKVEILYDDDHKRLEDAKVKVTNTGDRPIYSLHFQVSTDHNPSLPIKYGISSLYFGRSELRTFGNLANSDDPFLRPEENISFEVGKKQVDIFRRARRNAHQVIPEKYELIFQFLGFGDDTGFAGTNGKPFSFKHEQSLCKRFLSHFFRFLALGSTLKKRRLS